MKCVQIVRHTDERNGLILKWGDIFQGHFSVSWRCLPSSEHIHTGTCTAKIQYCSLIHIEGFFSICFLLFSINMAVLCYFMRFEKWGTSWCY